MLVMNCSRQPVRMKTVAFASLFAAASLLFADVVQADNFRVNYFLFESRREPEIKVPSRLTRPEVARLAEWRRVPVYAPVYGSASTYGYGPTLRPMATAPPTAMCRRTVPLQPTAMILPTVMRQCAVTLRPMALAVPTAMSPGGRTHVTAAAIGDGRPPAGQSM